MLHFRTFGARPANRRTLYVQISTGPVCFPRARLQVGLMSLYSVCVGALHGTLMTGTPQVAIVNALVMLLGGLILAALSLADWFWAWSSPLVSLQLGARSREPHDAFMHA